jgi:hypothetical protein
MNIQRNSKKIIPNRALRYVGLYGRIIFVIVDLYLQLTKFEDRYIQNNNESKSIF